MTKSISRTNPRFPERERTLTEIKGYKEQGFRDAQAGEKCDLWEIRRRLAEQPEILIQRCQSAYKAGYALGLSDRTGIPFSSASIPREEMVLVVK